MGHACQACLGSGFVDVSPGADHDYRPCNRCEATGWLTDD